MIAIALLGLTVRLGYVFIYQYHVHIGGDSFYYHYGANLLATATASSSRTTITSGAGPCRPPSIRRSTSSSSALESFIGLLSYTDHQVLSCLIGTATIFIIGYTARELFGKGAGIFAAVIVAIYPYFWFNDGGVLSEGARAADHRTDRAAGLPLLEAADREVGVPGSGVGIALATLSRAEAILLPVLLMVPLVLWMKGHAVEAADHPDPRFRVDERARARRRGSATTSPASPSRSPSAAAST